MTPLPPSRFPKKPALPDDESRSYALEKANEALGYKSPKDPRTEIFIIVVITATMLAVLKTC
jgi:hypothetical protein